MKRRADSFWSPGMALAAIAVVACAAIALLSPAVPPDGERFSSRSLLVLIPAAVAGAFIIARLMRFRRRGPANSLDARAAPERGLILTAAAMMLVGLGLTTLAVWNRTERIAESTSLSFESQADRVTQEISEQLRNCVAGLRWVRALYVASHDVDRAEFEMFVRSSELARDSTGVRGLGFIQRIPREQLDGFIKSQRDDGAQDFTVHTDGDGDDLLIVKHLHTSGACSTRVGDDIGSNPMLRAVAERCMLTGEATLSGRITPGPDGAGGTELLYFLPVYRPGALTDSHADRRGALLGWTFFPLIVDDLLGSVARSVDDNLDLEVFDGTEATSQALLFDHERDLIGPAGEFREDLFRSRMLRRIGYLKVGGGQWLYRVGTTAKFESSIDRATPVLFGAGGAALSILLAVLVWSQGRSRARAIALLDARSEHRFNSLVDASPALIWTSGSDTKRTHFNRGWLDFTGCPLDAEVGDGWARRVHPQDLGRVLSVYSAAIAARSEFTVEYRLRHHSGDYRWIFDKGSPHLDALGVFRGYVGMAIDVTERRDAEEGNRRFSDMLQRTGSMARVGGWEVDLRDNRLTWSDEVYRIHELDKGSPLDVKNAISFYAPQVRPLVAQLLRQAAQHGTPWDLELPFVTAKGKELWVRVQGEAEMLSGRAIMLRGTFQDITDRKRNEVALIEARAAAEAANRSKSEFLANMSHEIRTPLTAILGYADILREEDGSGDSPARRLQTIDTIRNAGTHLMAILNDILDLSKIEAGKMNIEAVETPLVRILAEIESMVRPRASAKGIALTSRLGSPLPSLIMSDPTRLRQILINLVGNATKFTDAGSVSIEARVEDSRGSSRVIIDVLDTGPGLTPEHAARLFSPFTQGDATVTRRHGGTGLGLTICRRLAELMGGTVTIAWSTLGVGSCFRLAIPLVRAPGSFDITSLDVVRNSPAAVAPADVELRGRILLAEDGPDNQRLISFHLIKAGASVQVADNGCVALRMIEEAQLAGTPYDLLLTDMQMPEMDGYSLTRTLRSRGFTLPIVALTAHSMADDRKRCTDAGCDDYASKPIAKGALLRTCSIWMNKASDPPQRRAA